MDFFFFFFVNEKFLCEGGFADLKVRDGAREGKSVRVREYEISPSLSRRLSLL
jgi:hypothetical protein